MACVLISWCWFLFLAIVGWKIGKQQGFTQLFGLINKISASIYVAVGFVYGL